jgi:hypothetical protein
VACRDEPVELPVNDFGASVMVGHVEGVETRFGVARQLSRGFIGIDLAPAALHVRDLPKPGHDAADLDPWREFCSCGCYRSVRHG